MLLASNENVLQRDPSLNLNVEDDENVEELLQLRPPKPIDRKFERKKVIKDHSEIKKIEDKYPYEDYEYKYGYNDDSYDKYEKYENIPYDSDKQDYENKYERDENDYENSRSSYETENKYDDEYSQRPEGYEDHGYESEDRYDDSYDGRYNEHDERAYEENYNKYDEERHDEYSDNANRYDSGYENDEYDRNNEHHDKHHDNHHDKQKLLGSEMEESLKSANLSSNGTLSSSNETNTIQATNATLPNDNEEKTTESEEPSPIEALIKSILSNVNSGDIRKKLVSDKKTISNSQISNATTNSLQKSGIIESIALEMNSKNIGTTESSQVASSANKETSTTEVINTEADESRDEIDSTQAAVAAQSSTRSMTTSN